MIAMLITATVIAVMLVIMVQEAAFPHTGQER